MKLRSIVLTTMIITCIIGHTAAQDVADSSATASETSDSAADSATAAGVVRITTDPDSVALTIGGKDYGVTPVEITDLTTGSHTIELSMPGYFRRRATVQIDSAGAELHFELSRPATLTVISEPTGAAITLNGDDIGPAPQTRDKMRPGEYGISASMEGYMTLDTTITLDSGAEDTLRVALAAAPPPPQVLTEPEQPPQELSQDINPQKAKKEKAPGKRSWKNETILIAFFAFIAILVGVEASSY